MCQKSSESFGCYCRHVLQIAAVVTVLAKVIAAWYRENPNPKSVAYSITHLPLK